MIDPKIITGSSQDDDKMDKIVRDRALAVFRQMETSLRQVGITPTNYHALIYCEGLWRLAAEFEKLLMSSADLFTDSPVSAEVNQPVTTEQWNSNVVRFNVGDNDTIIHCENAWSQYWKLDLRAITAAFGQPVTGVEFVSKSLARVDTNRNIKIVRQMYNFSHPTKRRNMTDSVKNLELPSVEQLRAYGMSWVEFRHIVVKYQSKESVDHAATMWAGKIPLRFNAATGNVDALIRVIERISHATEWAHGGYSWGLVYEPN